MNIAEIRGANNDFIRSYERFGTNLFLKTLQTQATNYDPQYMIDAYFRYYEKVFIRSASRGYQLIQKMEREEKDFIPSGFFLTTWREWIRQWVLDNLMPIIAGVNENTLKIIQEITAKGIEDGLNPGQLAKLLRSQVGSKARALAIARTEGTTANNMGTLRSSEEWERQTGETLYKIWIHSGNPRDPRRAHIDAQNKPIPKGDQFLINGKLMTMPGDKTAGPSETISCLCTHLYMSERRARKRYPEAFK